MRKHASIVGTRPLVLISLLACASWSGQVVAEPGKLVPGARVRVSTSDGHSVTGLVQSVGADALRIRPDGEALSRTIPFSQLTKIEASGGRRGRGEAAWKKAKWGALIGAVPGAISLGVQHGQVGENGSSVAEAAALGAFSGALFGSLVGAAIGALGPGESWERISPSFHIGPAGGADSEFSFAVTLWF